MKAKTVQFTDAVADTIRRSKIEGYRLVLPEQLDRDAYLAVDKVLKLLGGKWNRAARAHVFAAGIPADIDGILRSGEVLDAKKTFQAYYTPDWLARELVASANVREARYVLEPSAGNGAIVRAVREANPRAFLTMVEVRQDLGPELLRTSGEWRSTLRTCDFLSLEPTEFDAVVMNPPFADHQDILHVQHALGFLGARGRLAAIMSPYWVTGTRSVAVRLRERLNGLKWSWEEVREDAFADAGTKVHTGMLVVTMR